MGTETPEKFWKGKFIRPVEGKREPFWGKEDPGRQAQEDQIVRQAVLCLLSEGHLLIEDVPGVGKTLLALALAKSAFKA